jgi:hypothetical protein
MNTLYENKGIFLASPYSTPDGTSAAMMQRYKDTVKACAYLAIKGETVYSPIVHWHLAAHEYNLPKGNDFWSRHNIYFITLLPEFYVLALAGWKLSHGTQHDIKIAKDLGKQPKLMFQNTTTIGEEYQLEKL